MNQPPIVKLSGVSKGFDSASGHNLVLSEVNLTLQPGQKASIVGTSGSGKSTLLSLITGLLKPDSGTVYFEGVNMRALNDNQQSELRSKSIGIALQSENLIPFLSAVENVNLALSFGGQRDTSGQALKLLERMKVAHLATYKPRQVSGGEAQRISLAVAIANNPRLLIADEMVAQLDVKTANAMVDDIFASDMAVLFVTHSPVLAKRGELIFQVKNQKVSLV